MEVNQVWYSGDWSQNNKKNSPYNGVKIEATSNYSPSTDDTSLQKLTSIDVLITDYTKDPEGVSSEISLIEKDFWYYIPIPENNNTSPPKPNTDFTITATDLYRADLLGKLELNTLSSSSQLFLNIQFSYGLPNMTRTEIGLIFQFDEVYQEK